MVASVKVRKGWGMKGIEEMMVKKGGNSQQSEKLECKHLLKNKYLQSLIVKKLAFKLILGKSSKIGVKGSTKSIPDRSAFGEWYQRLKDTDIQVNSCMYKGDKFVSLS